MGAIYPNEPKGLNKTLLKDLERRVGTTDLLDWIEKTADSLSLHGDAGGWIELTPALIQQAGARGCRYSPDTLGTSRLKIEADGNAFVEHHNFRTPEDRRFWIAHELGHLLWRDSGNPSKPLSPNEKQMGADNTIEWLCNRFAAALLLPRNLLSRTIDVSGLKDRQGNLSLELRSIPDFAKKLRVPERLFARRLFHDIYNSNLFVVRVGRTSAKISSDAGISVRWEAIPRLELAKPKRLSGRKIPPKMLPENDVRDGQLDGRWLALFRDAFTDKRARPLSRISSTKERAYGEAQWTRSGDCILAIQTDECRSASSGSKFG
jgi:hypothetical protein